MFKRIATLANLIEHINYSSTHIVFIVKHRNLKKRLKELEDQVSEQNADDTISNHGA